MSRKTLLYLLIPAALFAAGAGWFIFVRDYGAPPDTSSKQSAQTELTPPQPVRLEARWLLAGELFWGRQMERIAEARPEPTQYLFSELSTFNREQYDAWLGHMECPVADKVIPFEVQVNDLIFNCDPEYLEEFEEWFSAVSLANNHSDNVDGGVGLNQTRKNLESVGVQYYGHFDNSVLDDICEVVSLPARMVFDDESEKPVRFPVAMCGYHDVYRLPTAEELDVIKRFSGRFLTIASPQQGAEYQARADELKQQTYRGMIDRGADMVIASHPHWVQNTEVYKGKLIMYSVGNFMFDQEWSEEVKRGVALDLRVTIPYEKILDGWTSFDCAKFRDSCLRGVNELMLAKPKFEFEFDLVSAYHEGGLTRLAPDSVHQLNLKRTNWAQTLKLLGVGG